MITKNEILKLGFLENPFNDKIYNYIVDDTMEVVRKGAIVSPQPKFVIELHLNINTQKDQIIWIFHKVIVNETFDKVLVFNDSLDTINELKDILNKTLVGEGKLFK